MGIVTTHLLYPKEHQSIEILDSNIEFYEGQIFYVPAWIPKKLVVKEVAYIVAVAGANGSLIQNVWVEEMEDEK